MVTKTAIPNQNAPNFTSIFNWGVKITDFSELVLLAGHAAQNADKEVMCPGDPVGQTRWILNDIQSVIEKNGYAKEDIVRVEFTFTKRVLTEAYPRIFELLAEFFSDVAVKPSGGTFRVIDGLAQPAMLVEIEVWLAR